MRYLPVDGYAIPATYLGWCELADAAMAAILAVFTKEFLVDVSGSPLVIAVGSAFSIRMIGGRPCVPLHELESLFAQFCVAADDDTQDLLFSHSGLSPDAITRVITHVTGLPGWPGWPSSDDKHELCRRLATFRAGLRGSDLVQLRLDDFVGFEPVAAGGALTVTNWHRLLTVESLSSFGDSLSMYGVVSGLLGARFRSRDRSSAAGWYQLMLAQLRSKAGHNDTEPAAMAPFAVLDFLDRSAWPSVLVTRLTTQMQSLSDVRARADYIKSQDGKATAIESRLGDVVGAFPVLSGIVAPCHNNEMASLVRHLLASVDATSSFTAVSVESLAALNSALLALGHGRSDADTPQQRVEYIVAQKRLRDSHFEAASAPGPAAASASGSSSSSSSGQMSWFRRTNTDILMRELRSNDTYCGALVYSDAPTNRVVDEDKSGLDAMVQHADYKDDMVAINRVAVAKRSQIVMQYLLGNVCDPPYTPMFLALARSKPFYGLFMSNLVATSDTGVLKTKDMNWYIGSKGRKASQSEVLTVPKDFIDNLIKGDWHKIDFLNNTLVSFEEYKSGGLALPRTVFASGNVAAQWTHERSLQCINYTERVLTTMGYTRSDPNGFKELANAAFEYHQHAPQQNPAAHAANAQSVCATALADGGRAFYTWLSGPISREFPEFLSTSQYERARTKLQRAEDAFEGFCDMYNAYGGLMSSAVAAPVGAAAAADGDGDGRKKKKPKVPPPPTPPPPTPPAGGNPRAPGSAKHMIKLNNGTDVLIHWDGRRNEPPRKENFEIKKALASIGFTGKTCAPFQIVYAISNGKPEFKRLNAQAWCDCHGSAGHEDKDAACHVPIPNLTTAVLSNFRQAK